MALGLAMPKFSGKSPMKTSTPPRGTPGSDGMMLNNSGGGSGVYNGPAAGSGLDSNSAMLNSFPGGSKPMGIPGAGGGSNQVGIGMGGIAGVAGSMNNSMPTPRSADGGIDHGATSSAGAYNPNPNPVNQGSINNNVNQDLNTQAGIYGDQTGWQQQQQEILQQMMNATNPSQIQDLMAQLTLAQSQGNQNQSAWTTQQQQFAQQQYGQSQSHFQNQFGWAQQGYDLDKQMIEAQRMQELQQAGLSRDEAYAQMTDEGNRAWTNYNSSVENLYQEHDYGMGRATQDRDINQRGSRSSATARGATASSGFDQQWKDIADSYGLETGNIQREFDIGLKYQQETLSNIQKKLDAGKELTEKEYKMMVDATNQNQNLEWQAAGLQYNQSFGNLWNQQQQNQIGYDQGQAGFANQQQNIALQDKIRDIQYQIQQAQANNPSAVLGLQMQMSQLNQQMANGPIQNLPGIYAGAQAGLPMPTWQPSSPAWQSPPGWGSIGGR